MSKLTIGALVVVLALAGCGGAASTGTSTSRSTTSTAAARTTTTTTTRTSAPTPASHSATAPSATVTSQPQSPATTPGSRGFTIVPKHPVITRQDIAKAKAALRNCRANDSSITLKQLEKEAASPEGIQC